MKVAIICLVMFSSYLTLFVRADTCEFSPILQMADGIENVDFDIIDTISMGGTTITNSHTRLVSSTSLNLSKYEIIDSKGAVSCSVMADGVQNIVYYKKGSTVVEAPAVEAEDTLSRMHRFYKLRTIYESGCDVYYSGECIESGSVVCVFNMYTWGSKDPKWCRVFVDKQSGVLRKRETYDGECIHTRYITVIGINQPLTEEYIRSEFSRPSYRTMPIQQLISGGVPPISDGETNSQVQRSDPMAQEKKPQADRLVLVNATIERLPSVIEGGNNLSHYSHLLASAYCTRAYLLGTPADVEKSISIYRDVLAGNIQSELLRVESTIGLARACICKAYLVPAEREKMELAADSLLKKITDSAGADPVLRNIAGEFSMKWQTLQDRGQPYEVIDWFDWMEQIDAWKANHAKE